MRLYVLLFVAGLLLRPDLAMLVKHPGLYDPNDNYNRARNLTEGRGFVVDYNWQYHQRPAEVTDLIDYWMLLAALWPLYGGSEGDGRLPLPGRSSHSRLFGIAEA